MFSDLLKAGLIAMVGIGLYANWDKISANDANAKVKLSAENSKQDVFPVFSLDEFDCWFMDTMVEASGTLTNLTSDDYAGITVEVSLIDDKGQTMQRIRMQPTPREIPRFSKIGFKAMYVIGKLKPTQCRIANIMISGQEEVPFDARCVGCKTI